jgi:hypothetical protein
MYAFLKERNKEEIPPIPAAVIGEEITPKSQAKMLGRNLHHEHTFFFPHFPWLVDPSSRIFA